MSESYSKIEFLSTLPKNTYWEEKANVNPTGLTVEQIELGTLGHAYIPHLVKMKRELFSSRSHRHEVICSDPIARFASKRYIEEMTAKPFKSYDIDMQGNPDEIMADLWERWDQLKAHEALRAFYEKLSPDGYCLAKMQALGQGAWSYKAYGYFESPPDYWRRINMPSTPFHNIIYQYYVNYIPNPAGWEYCGNYNMHAEEEYLFPQEPGFFHFYRGTWNGGIGEARIQGIWASLTMLRKISFADYRRSSIFNTFLYPEDWDESKGLEGMIEAARRADEVEGIAMPMRVNPLTKEVEEWPRFFDRTMDQSGAMPRADPSSGGTLLRNAEYARVLIDLGYTETKLVGSQPGEVTGSKLDLTRDDEVDIREFQHLKPIIKEMNLWFLQNGLLEGLEADTLQRVQLGDYDIKCHVEWEVLENQVKAQELAAEGADQEAGFDASKQNAFADECIKYCLKNNMNTPGMIPVQSSWVQQVGVLDNRLWFKFKDFPYYAGYQLPNNEMAYDKFLSAVEGSTTKWGESGSTGAWIWENIWGGQGGKGPRPQMSPFMGLGIRYSQDPFSYIGAERSFDEQQWEQQSKLLTGGMPGLLGTQGTGAPMKLLPSSSNKQTGGKTMQKAPRTGQAGARTPAPETGEAAAVRPVPTIRHQSLDIDNLSYSKANALMKDATGDGFSSKTWVRFKKFLKEFEELNNFRVNSEILGNPMSFDVILQYNTGKGISNEMVCKKEWKKINAHEGDLLLYPDLKHGGEPVNVGTYKYWYDEKTDKPMVSYNKEEVYGNVKYMLMDWKKTNNPIWSKLNKDLPLSLSTEYYAKTEKHNGTLYQMRFHNGHGDPFFKAIAIVDHGNCDEPFCKYEVNED